MDEYFGEVSKSDLFKLLNNGRTSRTDYPIRIDEESISQIIVVDYLPESKYNSKYLSFEDTLFLLPEYVIDLLQKGKTIIDLEYIKLTLKIAD